ELCDLLDSFSPENADDLAALALADTLRKSRRAETAELAAGFAALAGDILPRLDALQRRVEDIAQTPLPPLTVTSASRGLSAIAKRDDGAAAFVASDDIVAALAQMTDEERTLALIKAARAAPAFSIPAEGNANEPDAGHIGSSQRRARDPRRPHRQNHLGLDRPPRLRSADAGKKSLSLCDAAAEFDPAGWRRHRHGDKL